MNSILDFICNNPFVSVIVSTIIILSLLFAIGFELPQKIVKLITIFYREQKLFGLFPRAISIFFERCFPINQRFVIPDIGDYIQVNRHDYKGYKIMKHQTWKYVDLTWEQVVAIAKENNH